MTIKAQAIKTAWAFLAEECCDGVAAKLTIFKDKEKNEILDRTLLC